MEVVFQSLATVLSLNHLSMLIAGVVMGLCVGILPGLGGIVGQIVFRAQGGRLAIDDIVTRQSETDGE